MQRANAQPARTGGRPLRPRVVFLVVLVGRAFFVHKTRQPRPQAVLLIAVLSASATVHARTSAAAPRRLIVPL